MITVDENYIFDFGKFKGSLLKDVADAQPSYVIWVAENVKTIEISTEIVKHCRWLLDMWDSYYWADVNDCLDMWDVIDVPY